MSSKSSDSNAPSHNAASPTRTVGEVVDMDFLRVVAGNRSEETIDNTRRFIEGDYSVLRSNEPPRRDPLSGLVFLGSHAREAEITSLAMDYWHAKDADEPLNELLKKALSTIQENHVIAATDLLVETLDYLLSANGLILARRLLDKVDPNRFPPPVLTALLTTISHAPDKLDRSAFQDRTWNALRTTWAWDEDRITMLRERVQRTSKRA